MRRQRALLVNSIIVFVISASIFDIVTDREHWPFSPYAMYSNVQERNFKWIRLSGLTEDGEIGLSSNLRPFDEPRLVYAFRRLRKRPDNLKKALQYCLSRYEAMGVAGIYTGPPIQGLRFYEVELDLDAWVRNKDQLYSKKLLYQIRQPKTKD
jgi:hypothetical protein